MSGLSERIEAAVVDVLEDDAYEGAELLAVAKAVSAELLRVLVLGADRVEMALSWGLYLTELADEIEPRS